MLSVRRILVAFRVPEALRDVLNGITDFAKHNGRNWRLTCVEPDEFEKNLAAASADGAMTVVSPKSARLVQRLGSCGVPMVNLLLDLHPRIPSVLSDDHAIGTRGAEYFLGRGFRNLAFLGINTSWSRARQAGFTEKIHAAGLLPADSITPLEVADLRFVSKARAMASLRAWSRTLARPVAVMTACDFVSQALLAACQSENFRVPGEIAILGVDNFPTVCELSPVPLSSIAQDFTRIGFEAARLLDSLMENKKNFPAAAILVQPGRLMVRSSTDILAFGDPTVVAALDLIHRHAATGINMKQLVRHVAVSRKWLDLRFKALVGHTASQEIRRCRLQYVRDLLIETDMPLRQIVARCQFSCTENLIRWFRAAEGLPPQTYRLTNRN